MVALPAPPPVTQGLVADESNAPVGAKITLPNPPTVAVGTPPTSTATFKGPPTGNVQAPAVITSSAAENQLQEMHDALEKASSDLQSMKQYNAVQESQPPQTLPNGATPPANTKTSGGAIPPADKTDTTSTDTLDPKISAILDSLTASENESATPTPDQQATIDNDTSAITDDQNAQDQVSTSLDAMDAGTYPLSAPEQAQVDSIRVQLSSALNTAQTYATNVLGGATAANAASGLEEYSPDIALGNIRSAINVGSAKVQAVTDKIVAAQTKLQTALQNNDYKTASKLYTQISSDIKLRTDEIGKIQTSVQTQTKQMHTDALNAAKEQITAIVNSDKLTATQKQNAVTNAIKQGTLDEKTANDAKKLLLQQQKQGASSAATKPPANTVVATESWLDQTRGADGYVDPNAYKQAFDSWISSGFTAKTFVANFPPKTFVNPSNSWLPAYLESKTSGTSSGGSIAAQIKAAFPTSGSTGGVSTFKVGP